MGNLNDIVTVNIDIASPAADSASFDNLLIVGPLPKTTPADPLPVVGIYSDLSEVVDAGYSTTGATADPVGIAARIAFSQNPKPSRIYIAAQQLDSSTGTPKIQTPIEALKAALDTAGWYVICPAGIEESWYEPIAEWTETQTKLFSYTFLSKTDPVSPIFFRSVGWCGLVTDNDQPGDVPQASAYIHVAAAAKCLAYPSGSETWAFKQLAAILPSRLSTTLETALASGNSNFFAQRGGRNITMIGKTRGGEWADVIRGRDWLQNDMQLRLYNLLILNPKIPYTNSGIALVQNEMIASLKSAQTRGIVAETEFDEDGNKVPGFTVTVPNAMSLTATQKASRVLSDCRFSARLAGAIHVFRVDGTLTY